MERRLAGLDGRGECMDAIEYFECVAAISTTTLLLTNVRRALSRAREREGTARRANPDTNPHEPISERKETEGLTPSLE